MKFLLKPVLALAMFVMLATGAKAQDTLRISLKEAIQIALSENPTIKVADQEIQLKKEANREVIWGLLPEVSLVGSFNHTIEKQSFAMMGQVMRVGTLNNASGGVTASLPVFVPALYQSMKLTKTDVKLALEKARSSRLDMVTQVKNSYYSILLAKEAFEVYKQVYENAVQNLEDTQMKYNAQKASQVELLSAKTSVANAIPNVYNAESSVILALWVPTSILWSLHPPSVLYSHFVTSQDILVITFILSLF